MQHIPSKLRSKAQGGQGLPLVPTALPGTPRKEHMAGLPQGSCTGGGGQFPLEGSPLLWVVPARLGYSLQLLSARPYSAGQGDVWLGIFFSFFGLPCPGQTVGYFSNNQLQIFS